MKRKGTATSFINVITSLFASFVSDKGEPVAEPAFNGTIKEGCERRYTVINESDIDKYLRPKAAEHHRENIDRLAFLIQESRREDGKNPFNNYIVINIDEPYIHDVVAILQSNGHWDGKEPDENNIVNEVTEAGYLHVETILELQRIRSLLHPISDENEQLISSALLELEEKFQKIHDEWSNRVGL